MACLFSICFCELDYTLSLADRSSILPQGVFYAFFPGQLYNSYRTTRLTCGFGIQKAREAGSEKASRAFVYHFRFVQD